MARTVTTNYQADGPPPVSGGSVTDSTWFAYADNDSDPFSREQDLYYLALALERHDHRDGRGLSVGRIDASAITAAALGPNSVGSSAIADGAVGTTELADNAVTTAKILDGTIKGVDMEPTAIVDRLGYTPINKAGDIDIGPLTFGKVGPPAVATTLTLLGNSGIQFGQGAISGNGSVVVARTVAGTAADFRGVTGGSTVLNIHNSNADHVGPGYSLGVLNEAASGWEILWSHGAASFNIPIGSGVAQGTAPIAVGSTTICPNLNANFLNGFRDTDFVKSASGGAVPSGMHAFFATAALMPTGWTRATSGQGYLLGISGTAFSQTLGENELSGSSWVHTHDLRNHHHGGADHTHDGTIGGTGAVGSSGNAGAHYTALSGTPDSNFTDTPARSLPIYAMVLCFKN